MQTSNQIFGHTTYKSTQWQVGEIRLGHGCMTCEKHDTFSSNSPHKDTVRLHFGTKGDYIFTYNQLNKSYDLIGGHHNLMYSNDLDMSFFNKTLSIETFGISFPKPAFIQFAENGNDDLKRFCEQVAEGKSVILSEKWGAIDANIQNALHDLVHSNFKGAMQDAFLLSKSIELLVMSVESCGDTRQNQPLFIKTKGDKEKIIAARDFINTKITNPPNLSEVSKAVGLNEYKLKRGFKEMFNNTVFGYLTEQRLHLAHRTLLDTQKSAAEIATDFGYGTPQYFNNAFKKKFGKTPLVIKKS